MEVLLKVEVIDRKLASGNPGYMIVSGSPLLAGLKISDEDIFAVVGEEPKAGSGRVDLSTPPVDRIATWVQDKPRRLTVGDPVKIVSCADYRPISDYIGKCGTIAVDDETDDIQPYLVEFPDGKKYWYRAEDVTRAEPDRPTVGDWVKIIGDSPIGEAGEIVIDDKSDIPFRVKLESGQLTWKRACNVVKVPPPAPKPKYHAGQKVVHRNHLEFGIGTITECSGWKTHIYDTFSDGGRFADGDLYLIDWHNRAAPWTTLEQNLIAVSE